MRHFFSVGYKVKLDGSELQTLNNEGSKNIFNMKEITSFGLFMHLDLYSDKQSEIEIIFSRIFKKISLHEKHSLLTLRLFRQEYKNSLNEINQKYETDFKKADLLYQEEYQNSSYDDDRERDSFAYHVAGLAELEYDYSNNKQNLKESFKELMDLYYKSMLISVYSLIESETKKICSFCHINSGSKIKLEHLESKDYFNSMANYFEFVINIERIEYEKEYSKIKELQLIRNKIIHEGAEFKADDSGINALLNRNSDQLKSYSADDKVVLRIVKSSFVENYINNSRLFFEKLFWLIDKKSNYSTWHQALKVFFEIIGDDVSITFDSLPLNVNNLSFIHHIVMTAEQRIEFKCKTKIKRDSRNDISIVSQIEDPTIEYFIRKVNENKNEIFEGIFSKFLMSSKNISVSFLLY